MNSICKIIGIVLIVSCVATAAHLKVDMDARHDTTAAGFLPWQSSEGTTKTFDGLTVSLTLVSPPADTAGKIFWFNKDGINKFELAMDCYYAGFDDGKINHPSFKGGTILMTLTGLSKGPHTITAYHNAPWPVSKYNRTIAACRVCVDTIEKLTVQPSQAVTNDTDIKSSFVTFEAADKPVQITFEPVGDPDSQLMTAVLNGFEIDRLASVESYANNPAPADGDEHVFANNDEAKPDSAGKGYIELNWKASDLAKHQDVYFGTSKTDVEKADTTSADMYKGRQPATTTKWKVSNLDSKLTYYWRIDTVKEDGSVIKGYLWTFRTRHLAYPGAEGYGRFARGGRFGRVIEVTTLDDYKPGSDPVIDGSLRKAITEEKGPRVVVFRVGGTIVLKDKLTIPADGGDIYVAGQTAPGDGICVVHYTFGILSTHDAIIRFIRTRVGDFAKIPQDGMGMSGCDQCIIDHCSISWSIDEGHSSRSAKNITFSRNIIAEALNKSVHYATHSYAGSISGNIGSYHHNLLAHCAGRNWSLAGGLEQNGQYAGYCDIRNNIVYNWKHRTTDGGVMRCNFVNNLYIPGPATTLFLLMKPDGDQMKTGNPQMFYITGNKMEGYPQYDKNNWTGTKPNYAEAAKIRSDKPFFPAYVTTQTPEEAYADVLKDVGATRPKRDAIDTRIIEDVKKRTFTYKGSIEKLPGIIDTQEDVGSYPTLKGGPVAPDTDHDGLPDWWEKKHSLNPNSPKGDYTDTHSDLDKDGFTMMDDYLEFLAGGGNPLSD